MACERYQDALNDVAAGASAPAELEAHLASCAACRAELDALRHALAAADGELARLSREQPSPALAARIRTAVAAADEAPPRSFALRWAPALAAAAVLAIGLAVLVRAPRRGGPVPGATPSAAPGRTARVPPVSEGTPAPDATAFPTRTASETRPAGHSDPPPRPARAAHRSEPQAAEVLIPAGEAEALLRFAAILRRRAVPAESLLVADLSAPLSEPEGVEIRPLEIVPLAPETESGGD